MSKTKIGLNFLIFIMSCGMIFGAVVNVVLAPFFRYFEMSKYDRLIAFCCACGVALVVYLAVIAVVEIRKKRKQNPDR